MWWNWGRGMIPKLHVWIYLSLSLFSSWVRVSEHWQWAPMCCYAMHELWEPQRCDARALSCVMQELWEPQRCDARALSCVMQELWEPQGCNAWALRPKNSELWEPQRCNARALRHENLRRQYVSLYYYGMRVRWKMNLCFKCGSRYLCITVYC